MNIFFLFILGLPLIGSAQTSYVPSAILLKKGGHELYVGGDYFKTMQTVSKNGSLTTLQDGESFSRLQAEAGGFYGANDNLQFGLGLRYRQNRSSVNSTISNQTEDLSNSGIQSTFLNMKYGFRPVGLMFYALEGTFRYTPYTNEEQSSTQSAALALGDDGNEYSAGLAVTYASLSNNYISLRTGLRRPGVELSDEVYWQAEGALAWRRFALVAGVDGVSSINQDPYGGEESKRPNINTGSSNLYNSINREWITPYAGVNLALADNWRVELRGSQVVSGRSTDLGTAFGLMIVRRSENDKKRVKDKRFKSYDIEASISKISPQKGYVMIDKGLTSDIRKGTKFDFFEFDYLGGNILVASGSVIQVKSETSIVKISQRYNSKKEIKEGLVGRASLK